tara:strand:- start:25190 stop:26044 length:855 start_codon:yes stop_codon:yes gene_type:complete
MATWKQVLTEDAISTSDTLGTSDVLVPSQAAVKTYVDSNSSYTLPLSADGTRGGLQIGYSENGKNYPVELASEKAFVNVPWTDTQLTTEQVQDVVGAMFTGNTETRISATYQDGDGTIDLVVNDMSANDDVSVANLKTALASGFGSDAVQIGDANDVVTIGKDLIVTGDLTVSGDTTTINTATLSVEDNTVILNSGTTGSATQDAGIEVERGNDTNQAFYWDESDNQWAIFAGTIAATATSTTPLAYMTSFKAVNASADPTGDENGIGQIYYDSGNSKLFIRTA